jgi:hypothetical protein
MSHGNIHEIPASVIAQWPQEHTDHPTDIRDGFTPYAVTIQGISTALLICRLWSRFKRYSGVLGIDDLLIFLGWVCIAVTVCGHAD